MTEAKIPVPRKVAMTVKLPEKRRYSEMDGRWAYFKVQRGWLCFKTEIAQCWKTEYSSRRVAKESFSPNHYNVLFDIKRNTVIITNNTSTIL